MQFHVIPIYNPNVENLDFIIRIKTIQRNSSIYCIIDMSKDESSIIYLKYKNLSDMLKVILFSSQSALGLTPMLYHITHNAKEILFIETGALGGTLVHYIVEQEKPKEQYSEMKQLTGEYNLVEKIAADTHSIYIPILELETTCSEYPV